MECFRPDILTLIATLWERCAQRDGEGQQLPREQQQTSEARPLVSVSSPAAEVTWEREDPGRPGTFHNVREPSACVTEVELVLEPNRRRQRSPGGGSWWSGRDLLLFSR